MFVDSILISVKPSLLNFCVTDGKSVVVTRYISSKEHEAASLVSSMLVFVMVDIQLCPSGSLLELNSMNTLKAVTTG